MKSNWQKLIEEDKKRDCVVNSILRSPNANRRCPLCGKARLSYAWSSSSTVARTAACGIVCHECRKEHHSTVFLPDEAPDKFSTKPADGISTDHPDFFRDFRGPFLLCVSWFPRPVCKQSCRRLPSAENCAAKLTVCAFYQTISCTIFAWPSFHGIGNAEFLMAVDLDDDRLRHPRECAPGNRR